MVAFQIQNMLTLKLKNGKANAFSNTIPNILGGLGANLNINTNIEKKIRYKAMIIISQTFYRLFRNDYRNEQDLGIAKDLRFKIN